VIIFTIGGMDGVLMAVAPVDFQVHNSLFLIAHFHSVAIGGVLFGFFAGYTYWFPKIFGFKLDEKLGEYAFFCWFFGVLAAFIPLYVLGLMGATRRLDHYDASTGWFPLFAIAAFGVLLVLVGIGFQVHQLLYSIKHRRKNRDVTGDPWNGRTLEWSTLSPPPFYNFAVIPQADARDAFWEMKKEGWKGRGDEPYEEIHMPKNSPLGVFIGGLSMALGFALVWHIFWLAALSLLAILACIIVRLSEEHTEYTLSASEMKRIEKEIEKRHHT
jgi:cytochrome o ubiquinol oxidase subunit 1